MLDSICVRFTGIITSKSQARETVLRVQDIPKQNVYLHLTFTKLYILISS